MKTLLLSAIALISVLGTPPIPPNIQCQRITLIKQDEQPKPEVSYQFQKAFRSQPHSCVGLSGLESTIKTNQFFSLDISLSNEDHKGTLIKFSLEDETSLIKLEISIFSFLKETAHYLAVSIVERTNRKNRFNSVTNTGKGKGFRMDKEYLPLLLKDAANQPDIHLLPFIKGFKMDRGQSYYFAAGVKMLGFNETHYESEIYATHQTSLLKLSYYRIEYTPVPFADGSMFESTHISTRSSSPKLPFEPAKPNHFHMGLNSFDFQQYPSFQFIYPQMLHLTSYSRALNVTVFSYRMFDPCEEGLFYSSHKKCVRCKEGEFGNPLTAHCDKCHPNCKSCIDNERHCLECKKGMVKKGTFCECPAGQFQIGDKGACKNCDPSCVSCFGNRFNCTEVRNTTVPEKAQQPSPKPQQPNQQKPPVAKPTGDIKMCPQFSTMKNGTCVCSEDRFMSNSVCQLCGSVMFGCLKCTSGKACSQCKNTMLLDPILKTCKCSARAYLSDGECVECSDGCLSCSIDKACLKCSPRFVLENGKCKQCDPGKVLLDSQCKQCSALIPNCQECTSVNTCTKCSIFSTLINQKCESCDGLMHGCLTCISRDECDSCKDGFSLKNTKCKPTQSQAESKQQIQVEKSAIEVPESPIIPKLSLVGGCILLFASTYSGENIGLQIFTLLQLNYFLPALIPVSSLNESAIPLSISFYKNYVNAYNNLIPLPEEQSQMPNHYILMGYRTNFSTALNFMLFLVIALMILAKLAGINPDGSEFWGKLSEKGWRLARYFTMFNAVNLGFSLGINAVYRDELEQYWLLNAALAVTAVVVMVYFLVTEWRHPDICEPYTLKPACSLHNIFYFSFKLLIGLFISLTGQGSLIFGLQLLFVLLVYWSWPFLDDFMNYRLVFNEIVLAVLLIYPLKGGENFWTVCCVLVLSSVVVATGVWGYRVLKDCLRGQGHLAVVQQQEKPPTFPAYSSTHIKNQNAQ